MVDKDKLNENEYLDRLGLETKRFLEQMRAKHKFSSIQDEADFYQIQRDSMVKMMKNSSNITLPKLISIAVAHNMSLLQLMSELLPNEIDGLELEKSLPLDISKNYKSLNLVSYFLDILNSSDDMQEEIELFHDLLSYFNELSLTKKKSFLEFIKN